MAIKFKCSCGKSLSVPDKMAGKTGKCPACAKEMLVPTSSQEDSVDLDNLPAAEIPGFADEAPAAAALSAEPEEPTIAMPPRTKTVIEPAPAGEAAELATGSSGVNTKGMRPCPKCGEMIKLSARTCKSCGSEFQGGRIVKKRGGFLRFVVGLIVFVLHTAVAGVAGYIALTEDSLKEVRVWVDENLAKRTTAAPSPSEASSAEATPSASASTGN